MLPLRCGSSGRPQGREFRNAKPAAARTAVFSVSESKKKPLEEERRQCGHEKVHVKHVEVKKYKWGMKPGGPQLTFVCRKY